MTPLALRYLGDGEFRAMHPGLADKAMVIGEVHRWVIAEHRSNETHRHYFAVLADAWGNLPEKLADEFPSPEHLRKRALIRTGYCTETRMALKTGADAVRTAGFLQDMDEYAEIGIFDNVLVIRRAKSQNMRAMDRKVFAESKEKVLHWISELIGADVAEHGGKAA